MQLSVYVFKIQRHPLNKMQINLESFNLELRQKSLLSEEERKVLLRLWNDEYPKIISHTSLHSFDCYLEGLENVYHYLLIDMYHDVIKGWAFTFERDNLRWFAIILSSTIQKKGIGRIMLKYLISKEKHLRAWVIDNDRYVKSNGQPYISPLSFYTKLGYKISKKDTSTSGELSVIKIDF